MATITEMTPKLAEICDPGPLLQDLGRVTSDIVPMRHATVGILDEGRRTISGRVCASGVDAPSVMAVIAVLWLGPRTNKLVGGALRLRDVSSDYSFRIAARPVCVHRELARRQRVHRKLSSMHESNLALMRKACRLVKKPT